MKHLKLFFALFAMLALGVGNAWGATYTKVTSAPADWSGEYIVVYESNNTAYVWTGVDAAKCNTTATISSNSVTGDFVTVTIAPMTGGYSIKVNSGTNSGKYISGTSGSNKLNFGANAQLNTLSYETDWVKITSNTSVLTFNKASSDMRFRYYKAASYSAQQHIQLYKLSTGGSVTPDPITVTLDKSTLSLEEGENATLTATVTGSTDAVTWTSDASNIASVDNAGKVTAVAAGEATITAAIGDVKATCSVTVTAATTPEEPGTGGESGSYTWDLSKKTYTTGTNEVTWTCSIATMHNTGTNATNYLGGDASNRSSSRFYTGNTLSITPAANVTITSVEFTATSTNYANVLKTSTWTNATASVSGSVVTVTPTNGASAISATVGGTCGFTGVTVNYTKAASDEPQPVIVKTLKSIAVTPTTITYEQGDVFSFDGTCTATYSVTKDGVAQEDETKEVTPTSVSTPDMSTTGDKVITVTYTESEVTVETTYNITVTENTVTPGTYSGNLNNVFFGCSVGNNAEEQSGKLEDILVVSGCTQSATTKTSYQSDHVRYYADNYLKFSAPAGYLITAIQFTAYSSNFKWDGEITATVGTYDADGKSWTGSAQEVQFNFGKQNRIASVSVTYAEASKYALTIATPSNGTLTVKDGENAVATGDKFYAGTQLTVTATPVEGYKLASVKVIDGSSNDVTASVYDNGTLTIPEYDVTISATFEAAKTLTSIEITTSATQTTFWQGETFNYTGLKVTAHFDGAADEVVTPTVTGSTATAGTQTVTVSFTEGTVTKTATYTITVKAIPNTKETAYSVADAYDIINKLGTASGVFISGIISQVDSYNSTYKSITYWISADGTTTNQLQAYSGKGLESADFSGKTDLSVGDQVIVCGNLKKYSGTYEFDKNNYLASHTPTTKDPAGLAYATTSYTANVGEAFTTPELTNPHNLVVTYSTSDASKATVDANTGAVTIEAAGVVTITAATTGDASHDAGSASYTITISNPAMAVATLPFTFNSGKADIENTAGMTQNGLGSDYSSAPNSQLKFDHTGDWIVIRFDSEPGEFSFLLKQNGSSAGTFTVYESANGEDYTSVWAGGDFGNAQSETIKPTLSESARYVKFEYTTKPSGTNYGLGQISIKKIDKRQEAGLAWNPTSVTLTQGEAFAAPTLQYPNDITGTITYESSNEDVATINAEGEIALGSATGTATITATFAGDENYKPATATCTITVNEYIETIDGEWQLVTDASKLQAGMEIIIASVEVDGKYYTMGKASENGNNRTVVESTISGDKLNPAVGTTVLTLVDAGNGTFALQASNGQYLYAASSSSNYLREQAEISDNAKWAISVTEGKASVVAQGTYTHNIIRYNSTSTIFSCYASGQQGIALYKKMPDYTRVVDSQYYGTICLPKAGKFVGGSLYEVAHYDVTTKKVYFDEVLNGEMEAGMPYIFLANATMIEAYYTNDEEAAAQNKNGLYGTLVDITSGMNEDGVYMIYRNQIIHSTNSGSYLNANRAYIKLTEVPGYNDPSYVAQAPAPGRKRIAIGQAPQVATGVDQVQGDNVPTKMIINGQLFILRGEKMYDAQGKLVK